MLCNKVGHALKNILQSRMCCLHIFIILYNIFLHPLKLVTWYVKLSTTQQSHPRFMDSHSGYTSSRLQKLVISELCKKCSIDISACSIHPQQQRVCIRFLFIFLTVHDEPCVGNDIFAARVLKRALKSYNECSSISGKNFTCIPSKCKINGVGDDSVRKRNKTFPVYILNMAKLQFMVHFACIYIQTIFLKYI